MNLHLPVKHPSILVCKPPAVVPTPLQLQRADNGLQVISNTDSASESSCFCPLLSEADLALAELKEGFELCDEGCDWCLNFRGREREVVSRIKESCGRNELSFCFLLYGVRKPCFKNRVENRNVPGKEAERI